MNYIWYDITVLLVYFVSIVSIGLYAGRKQKNLEDFALGSRKMPWWAVLFSIIAAETSAATFVGVPAESFQLRNFTYIQLAFGMILARILVSYLFIKPYYDYKVYSIYEFLTVRFGTKTKNMGSVVFLITRLLASGVRIYMAAVIIVVAYNFITHTTPNLLQYLIAIAMISFITALYTIIGGIKAVIWTDVIQATVMFSGAVAAIIIIFFMIPDGWSGIKASTNNFEGFKIIDWGFSSGDSLSEIFKKLLTTNYTIFSAMIGMTFLTLATHGTDQDMVQRMLTAKDYKKARFAVVMSGIADIPIVLVFLTIGYLLYAYFSSLPDPNLPETTNEVFPYFIINYIPVGIRGLIIAGIFSTAMGSLSTAMNALATSFAKDFYIPYFKREASDKHYVKATRIITGVMTFLLTGIAVITAYWVMKNPETTMISIALSIITYTYGALLGVFLLGITTKNRGSDKGNAVAMICGFLSVILIKIFTPVSWIWFIFIGTLVTYSSGAIFKTNLKINNSI
ncbi:sodium:solute symporter [candidate division KSB1 bacterium]